MNFCIDGRFITRGFGGQERYTYEILSELDSIIEKNEIELVIPECAENIPEYKNIKTVKYGKRKGLLWEQIDFYKYLKKNNKLGVYLCNTWPYFRPDIVTLHDAVIFAMPRMYYKNIYGFLSITMHRILFKSAKKRAKVIFTISKFSKDELIRFLKIDESRIKIVDCGWQHINRIEPDYRIFDSKPFLEKKSYFLSVSSRTPQKNFQWIENAAKHNPNCTFIIAGPRVGLTTDKDSKLDNIKYLGRVSDGELKALMIECKALIHPAIYEGFGMTPMEAMAVGSRAIVAKAACLPEIYEKSVYYIDPYDSNIDLNKLMEKEVQPNEFVLNKYSWKSNAIELYSTLKKVSEDKQ